MNTKNEITEIIDAQRIQSAVANRLGEGYLDMNPIADKFSRTFKRASVVALIVGGAQEFTRSLGNKPRSFAATRRELGL